MNPCCRKLLDSLELLQRMRIEALKKTLKIIEQKKTKTDEDRRRRIVLKCWEREIEIFLDLLKEIK